MDYWEMFDLEKDPQELKSIFDQPESRAVREKLEAELARLRQELKVPETIPQN